MITKLNKGWRNVLMLCAAAVVAVLVSSCRAPASDAGRYQWMIVSRGDYPDDLYVFNTENGEAVKFDSLSNKWVPSSMTKPLPDWNDIQKQREEREKRAKEAREKREALVKAYSQMPLEKQVAWANNIVICKYRGKKRFGTIDFEVFTTLKGKRGPDENRWPYKSTDDNLVVWFDGMVEGSQLSFWLSHTPIDSKGIFLAPKTIIDDVKAEIKRQAEKQKETHAENH